MKKSVLQRKGDGTEAPVVKEEGTKPWPMFDKIYKRQNQKVDKNKVGGEGDFSDADDDDNDSISSDGPVEECPLAPPPPTFAIGSEEEECVLDEDDGGDGKVVGVGSSLATPTQTSITRVADERVPLSREEKSIEVSTKSEAPSTQESGIPTAEAPKTKTTPSPPQARLASPIEHTTKQNTSHNVQSFPTQKLSNTQTDPTNGKKTKSASKKYPRKKNVSLKSPEREVKEVTPSIPRTICYSLRSAIGDGTARQRNSHSLMERRPLMPNGSQVECSYWSHKGNRNYMEGEFCIFLLNEVLHLHSYLQVLNPLHFRSLRD